MPSTPRVSVVIPCYNAERYIASTLRSVVSQEWPELEVIVVDDGSTDASPTIVKSRFPDVTLLRQQNAGVAAARNRGIAHASGEWIAFIDADDYWLPGKLGEQWKHLRERPGCRMSYTGWHVWASEAEAPDDTLLSDLAHRVSHGATGWIYTQLLTDCVVWTSTVLMHRSLFDEIGTFDADLRIGEDWDLWLRASRATQIMRVPRPLALYRSHPVSITRRLPQKNWQGIVVGRALSRWGLQSPDGTRADEHRVKYHLARSWSSFGAAHLAVGDITRGWESAVTAMGVDWRHLPAWKLLAKCAARGIMPSALRH